MVNTFLNEYNLLLSKSDSLKTKHAGFSKKIVEKRT